MIIEHPFQKTIEETLARDDLVVLPKLRTVCYQFGKLKPSANIYRSLLYFVAPKNQGIFYVSELNALLHSLKPSVEATYVNFSKTRSQQLQLGKLILTEEINGPDGFEFSEDEFFINHENKPFQSLSGQKYIPGEWHDKLFYGAVVMLHPHEEFAQRNLEQAKKSVPFDDISWSDFKVAQRKYKPNLWQRWF